MISRLHNLGRSLLVIAISLSAGLLLVMLMSDDPGHAARAFFLSVFSNRFYFGNLLAHSIPLMLTGLAASVAFTASCFNLGMEGQVYLGALAGTSVGILISDLVPGAIGIAFMFTVSFFFGASVASISAILKIRTGVSELISSLLLSNGIVLVVDYFVEGPLNDRASGLAASISLPAKFRFNGLMLPSGLHTGIFFSLCAAFLLWFFLFKTREGFKIRIVGKNRAFAFYAGLKTNRLLFWALFLSGGLASTAGIIDVVGIHGRVMRGFSSGYGWNGIAIALIARNNPVMVIPAALFFAYLESGAQIAALEANITPEFARIVQAVIFFLITAEALVPKHLGRKRYA
ncbi:MAG: riboflavin transport system permease protein [Mesotoga sp.]|nr:riboflavin transport system permease protein [Mesotoga sp.]